MRTLVSLMKNYTKKTPPFDKDIMFPKVRNYFWRILPSTLRQTQPSRSSKKLDDQAQKRERTRPYTLRTKTSLKLTRTTHPEVPPSPKHLTSVSRDLREVPSTCRLYPLLEPVGRKTDEFYQGTPLKTPSSVLFST